MGEHVSTADGAEIILALVTVINENRQYLSDIDGAIGDGDHGINMAKGFTMAGDRLSGDEDLSAALKTLGSVLMMEIGGSMGPLYGKFFRSMARESNNVEALAASDFLRMLKAGYESIVLLGDAKPGDKTLVDTLVPAIDALEESVSSGEAFGESLGRMRKAAEEGKNSTKDMVARLGRASRLGERSRGVLDAGATSCWLILDSLAGSFIRILDQN